MVSDKTQSRPTARAASGRCRELGIGFVALLDLARIEAELPTVAGDRYDEAGMASLNH
jgi:hypothetical protein